MKRLARLGLFVATASAAVSLHAQTGNLYELPDYEYFEEPAPSPTPAATPVATPKPASPAPSAASTPLSAAASPSATPTPSASSVASGAVGAMAAARADAKALATPQRAAAAELPTTADLSAAIPHYTSAPLPQQAYMDDPDALAASGASAASGSDQWRTVTNPARTTVTLGFDELARAKAIEDDPNAYTQGQALGGATGSCTALPPATGGQGSYEATCNVGTQVQQGPRSCAIPLVVSVVQQPTLQYFCLNDLENDPDYDCATFTSAPVCQAPVLTSPAGCYPDPNSIFPVCLPDFFSVDCSAPVSAQVPTETTTAQVVERRDESQCQAFATTSDCALSAEVCTSSDPVTRIVDGVSVTKPCWAWSRTYQCTTFNQASDCQQLESNASCTFAREICLDDPPNGPCQVKERVYNCPLPGNPASGASEYICSGDLYCLNGDCEPIVREASTEFKDALVGLHTLGQANAEFNEASLTLFSGERETCHKKVFGLSNCCSGRGAPLLTPFVCSASERELDEKDDKGLCHKVGTYCSDSVLGVCVTRKDAYCCFASKLTRILQEQGRPQIGMPWGRPKTEQCRGFTVDQFAQLDLSVMDFTEVYAEFVDAAKLPDEVQTTQQIQQRIVEYYEQRATTP